MLVSLGFAWKILPADILHVILKPALYFRLGLKVSLRFVLHSIRLYCTENTGLYDVPEATEYTRNYIEQPLQHLSCSMFFTFKL